MAKQYLNRCPQRERSRLVPAASNTIRHLALTVETAHLFLWHADRVVLTSNRPDRCLWVWSRPRASKSRTWQLHYAAEWIQLRTRCPSGFHVFGLQAIVCLSFMKTTFTTSPLINVRLYFVYIGIARFGCIYIYSTTMTYTALKLGRNMRHDYMRSALRQDISFFDHGSAGSISMQATSNGRLIQSGTSEKLGQMIQATATLIAAFIIAFVTQWKLTLISICIVPALILMVGTAGGIDAGIETDILKIYAQAGAFAESSLGNIRAINAFSLGTRIVDRYSVYLEQARTLGRKKDVLYGLLFAGEYFVMFAGMGLAFWQGIAMIARGEVDGIGTVFT